MQVKPSMGSNLRYWDRVCDDLLPRALARAVRHHNEGLVPRVKEDVVIDWLHGYFDRWRISDTDRGWESIGDEFDDDLI